MAPNLSEAGGTARVSALDTFKVEGRLAFDRGAVEVRQYDWTLPCADVWTPDIYFLHMCLTPRPGKAWAVFLDSERHISQEIGRVMFVPPGQRLYSGGAIGSLRSLSCSLAPSLVEDLLDRRPCWRDAALAEGLSLNRPEIEWFMLKLYRELRQPGFGSQMMADALGSGLAIALIRAFRLDSEPQPSAGGLAPWRMRLIRERVHADQPPPRLGELAALCGISVRHLSRGFRQETGMTVAEFTSHALIERAQDLLANSRLSIAEIAAKLGFATSPSFAYAFRRATGARPTEYRALSCRSPATGTYN